VWRERGRELRAPVRLALANGVVSELIGGTAGVMWGQDEGVGAVAERGLWITHWTRRCWCLLMGTSTILKVQFDAEFHCEHCDSSTGVSYFLLVQNLTREDGSRPFLPRLRSALWWRLSEGCSPAEACISDLSPRL